MEKPKSVKIEDLDVNDIEEQSAKIFKEDKLDSLAESSSCSNPSGGRTGGGGGA